MKVILVFSLILLSGCGLEKEVVDDIHIITGLGYDYIEENQFEGTAIVPIYATDKSLEQETYSSVSALSKDIRDKSNLKSSEPLVGGKLEVVLYGEELARQGIQKILDTLIRDPSVGANVHLAVAEEYAKDILATKKSKVEDIGVNISKLIEQNIQTGALPHSNIHQFVDSFYEEGLDPTLPILKKTGNDIEITGIALFKGDKYVDSIVVDNFFAFRMLFESFSNGSYMIHLGENDKYASIQNITTKSEVNVKNIKGASPVFNYDITINGMIKEYSGNRVTPKVIEQIKKKMEQQLKNDTDELLHKFKEHNVDPIGLGRRLKRINRNWDEQKNGMPN